MFIQHFAVLKTYLRSTMTQEMLSGLALMNVHLHTSYMPLAGEVRSEFLLKKRRLMEEADLYLL